MAAGGPPRRNLLFKNVSHLAVAAVTCGVDQKPYLVYESSSPDDAHAPLALSVLSSPR